MSTAPDTPDESSPTLSAANAGLSLSAVLNQNPSSEANPTPAPTVIDHTAFPHIVDMIMAYTTFDAWVVMRATSGAFRERMEGLMCRHVVLAENHRDNHRGAPHHHFLSSGDKRIPCLALVEPLKQRTLGLIPKYTEILDDNTGGRNVSHHAAASVDPKAFRNIKLMRFYYGSFHYIAVPKAVHWHSLPALMTIDDRWGERLDWYPIGRERVPHQVHHYLYDAESIVFPDFNHVVWPLVKHMVFIFEERPKIEDNDEWDEMLREATDDPSSQCGRTTANLELLKILKMIGAVDDGETYWQMGINSTFVGLGKLLNIPFKDQQDTHPVRDFLNETVESWGPFYSIQRFLNQFEFLTHEEYILRVGHEQYELETSRPSM